MKKSFLVIGALVIVLGGAGVWALIVNAPPSRRQPSAQTVPESHDGLQQPTLHTERVVASADTVLPHPTPVVTEIVAPIPGTPAQPEKKLAPMRIYTSNVAPTPPPEEVPQGDYAPAYRMVRCKLVNTIDSSSITTPIVGLVTDDLTWGGKIIIPKCSEVHGVAQVDKSRERIAAEGAWTFTLYDQADPGLGRELVVKGLALDREDDPEFKKLLVGATVVDSVSKTWGITDGSSGLRGVVIRSNNAEALQLFVACFISGIAQSVQGSVTNVFGQTVPSPNASGAGGVSGSLINPPAQGVEAVMDRYAQMVMDSIEKDGFFIRVPAGKLFYVYVTEDILTGKATVGGAARLHDVQSEFLEDRSQQEKVTQPRSDREAKASQAAQNGVPYVPIDPTLTHSLDAANNELNARSADLRDQSNKLAQPPLPIPTPTP
jgi:hypothetical protein